MEEVEDYITINKTYASKYEAKKRTEELSKLRDRYGDVALESSESGSSGEEEEEDEDAEMLTTEVEKDFLRTLSLIHSRDPRIYDKNTHFFEKDGGGGKKGGKEKEKKPMFLKDYERQQLLERGAMAGVSDSEEEEEGEEEEEEDRKNLPATYLEEQEQLKAEFHQAAVGGEREEDEDGLLKIRKKGKEEIEEEERDYVQWLKGEKEKMAAGEGSDLSGLRTLWSAPDLDSGEAFLRDYILNRQFLDRDKLRVPSYKEVVGEESEEEEEEEEGEKEDEIGVSEDEDALDKQEDFEKKYNFRFEEPGGDQITTYPRTVAGSVRREDDRRKEKRKAREERREREKEQKQEEIKRLKKLKRREIEEKLDRIKRITGNPNVGFGAADLDGEFDPASYDQAMSNAFNDDYYGMEEEEEDEGEGERDEDGKPVFSDDEYDGGVYGDWDEWDPDLEPHCDDPEFNMDAEYDPDITQAPPTKKSKLHRRTRHKLAEAMTTSKPQFDPEERSFEEYFDEYYNLDYEDVIGDMACRFKYNHVPANSFGLSIEELLACEDKELNQWASLKKAVQIRTEEEEERDKRKYKKQARNFKKKYQILASLKEPQEEEEQGKRRKLSKKTPQSRSPVKSEEEPISTNISEVERVASKGVEENGTEDGIASSSSGAGMKSKVKKKQKRKIVKEDDVQTSGTPESSSNAKKRRKKKKSKVPQSAVAKLSSSRLKSYGL